MQAPKIVLSVEERAQLERWARGRTVAVRLAQCAQIVLLAATGMMNKEIVCRMQISHGTVGRWRGRFFRERCAGIKKDLPRNGRSKARSVDWAQRIVAATTQTKPANATHWSLRLMAAHLGTS